MIVPRGGEHQVKQLTVPLSSKCRSTRKSFGKIWDHEMVEVHRHISFTFYLVRVDESTLIQ